MDRKQFLATLALLPFAGKAMKIRELNSLVGTMESTGPMPVFFVGHGSPMNAIEQNEFTDGWRNMVAMMPKPKAILCISAHWETQGTFVTAMPKPRTIHDFGGFPQQLFDVQYPAPGSPELAEETKDSVHRTTVVADAKWGLDHGAWSVLLQMFPDASVPVVQLSLDYSKDPQYHYDLAKELAVLRSKGILIIGSGNLVHNLRAVDWSGKTQGFDWAMEADQAFRRLILGKDHKSLIDYRKLGKAAELAIPTPEHYLPLLYVLALQDAKDEVTFYNEKLVMGSISMRSVRVG